MGWVLATARNGPPAAGDVAGQRCPLCGGEGSLVGVKDGVKLRLCCDSLLAWGWSSEEEYEAWYSDPEAYHVVEPPRNGQRPFIERISEHGTAAEARLALIQAYLSPARGERLLDV